LGIARALRRKPRRLFVLAELGLEKIRPNAEFDDELRAFATNGVSWDWARFFAWHGQGAF
jgi:hypothetical protein